jgi:glycosyltransferase involved in cell wall biosynthesis
LLVTKIEEGFDVVSGWRKNRRDNFFMRTIPSRVANALVGVITGLRLHDYGCSLKAYRRELLEGVRLYGEMHRFIPAYAFWNGARVTEVAVNHRPRTAGEAKYGISRTFRVLLDLVVLKFLSKYMNRPMHFFGGVGFIALFLGFCAGSLAVYLKIAHIRDFVATPLPVFSALLIIIGVQLVLMGVIAEILIRIYYESQNKTPFVIREKVNLADV